MLISFFLRQFSSNNHHYLADRNIKSPAMYSQLIRKINIFIDTYKYIYMCVFKGFQYIFKNISAF